MTSEYLATPFLTAFLLTGSAKRAEAAMLEGIRAWDGEVDPDEELLRNTVRAALGRRQTSRLQPAEETAQAPQLPVELQRVARLPLDLRQCYVLRLLVGWSREACARLLFLDTDAVDRDTGLAAQALAEALCVSQGASGGSNV
jgi:hypothetical protein